MDKVILNTTSENVSVSIELDPKSVVHTSWLTLLDEGYKFISKYPKDNAPTDIIAIAWSPLILELLLVRSRSIALIMVIGNITYILFEILKFSLFKNTFDAVAIAIAKNAT